jgi:hypothetical protein
MRSPVHTIVAASMAAALAGGMVTATAVAAPQVGSKFGSCAELNRVYPNGVAKNKKAANRAVRQGFARPSTTKRARALYVKHPGLDRDRDGVACEQTA